MFDAATDPLGIGVKSRGMNRRQQFEMRNLGHNMGPLADPQWQGLLQALQEAGVSRVADNSVGEARGMFSPSTPYEPTFDPETQSSAVATVTPVLNKQGQQVATSTQRRPSSHIGAMAGLDSVVKGLRRAPK